MVFLEVAPGFLQLRQFWPGLLTRIHKFANVGEKIYPFFTKICQLLKMNVDKSQNMAIFFF